MYNILYIYIYKYNNIQTIYAGDNKKEGGRKFSMDQGE